MLSDATVIEGETIHSLIDACREKFFAYSYLSESHNTHILLIDEASYFKDRSTAVIIIFDFGGNNRCRVDLGVAGEAESAWLNRIRDFIIGYALEIHLKVNRVDTNFVSSFVPKPTPASFLKKCVRCNKEIPLASKNVSTVEQAKS